MAAMRTGSSTNKKSGQPEQTLRHITFMDDNQHLAASFGQHSGPLDTTQQQCNVLPGNYPENSMIVREALRMNLPPHLVLGKVQRRVQTHGANYTEMKELVADLFATSDRSNSTENQEVPMETNQLEDALMMNSELVKKTLRMGVPPHLIKTKVRAKILTNGVGYADVNELLTDLDVK
ncbi:baculoviral IAP repeat-containing protein 3-like [Thunnus maccoyii]|uniref:baculoviral IAP repeat-containing protein 3-like n=1 Tax=Thunnus maccoyii TaxID=8240 RepID=UPI001C4ACC00|nr:baculoviral IAP repeat-containing protein 3-like [Thunnus maccoyii]XP_042257947.1 baculoviral IAP repeat-containing protein 3-like [Thunnus maccoyii]